MVPNQGCFFFFWLNIPDSLASARIVDCETIVSQQLIETVLATSACSRVQYPAVSYGQTNWSNVLKSTNVLIFVHFPNRTAVCYLDAIVLSVRLMRSVGIAAKETFHYNFLGKI